MADSANITRRTAVVGIASALVSASAATVVAAAQPHAETSELLALDAKLSVQIAASRDAALKARPLWLACQKDTEIGRTVETDGPKWATYVKASKVWNQLQKAAHDTAGKMMTILPADFTEFAAVVRAYAFLNCEESLGDRHLPNLFDDHAEFDVAQFAADLAKRASAH